MKFIELGNKKWRVLALCDQKEDCQILDHLIVSKLSSPAWRKMTARLTQMVPENGPEFNNRKKVKMQDDGIYAFREQPPRGPKPRVYFFRDGNDLICTEAIDKRNDNVTGIIRNAKIVRERYFEAKESNQIEIEKYDGEQ